jgi:isoaspartyl peptidase/L-asparaginase-like protein (Ntn-hydrolase superfamily)
MKPSLIVHGGCGTPPPGEEAERNAACERSADAGWAVLQSGGSALDAVEAAARALEDEPLLNAGTGPTCRPTASPASTRASWPTTAGRVRSPRRRSFPTR